MGGYSVMLAAPVASAYGAGSLIATGGATLKSSALQATNWFLLRPAAQFVAADIAYTTGEIAMGIDGPGGLITPADSLRAAPKAAQYADELFDEMRRLELGWPTMMRQLDNSGVPLNMANRMGTLTYDSASKTWTSAGGLVYGQGSVHGNRILHVFDHLTPNTAKPAHSIFKVQRNELLGLLDNAWLKRGAHTIHNSGNWNYRIDMGRVIGLGGETAINIFVLPGTNEIITAFPIR